MVKFVSTRTAKAKLSHYLNGLKDSGPVVITSRGLPKGILMAFAEDELDGFVIRHSEKIHKAVMEGLVDIQQGKTYSVKEAREKLEELE